MNDHSAWLAKAEDDRRSAERLLAGDDPILETAAYHAQQCAEKALKAFLVFSRRPFERVHDLGLLTEQCMEVDPSFGALLDVAEMLSPLATAYRYPGLRTSPDPADVAEALAVAERILAHVKERVTPPAS